MGSDAEGARCGQCGGVVDASAPVCAHCGRRRGDYDDQGRRKTPAWAVVAVAAVVAAGAWWAVSSTMDDAGSNARDDVECITTGDC